MNLNNSNQKLQPNSMSTSTFGLTTRPRAGRVISIAAALAFAMGSLTACDTASTTSDTVVGQSSTPSPSTTPSVEAIDPQDLLPNAEAIRTSLDETSVQIPYRDDYTGAELAKLSSDQILNIRQMFNNNQEILGDNFDKWAEAEYNATGDYQTIDYMEPLVQVLVDIAKDNIISEDYMENLQPGDYNFMKTVMGSTWDVLEHERSAVYNGTEYNITNDLVEVSQQINYADDGTIYVGYIVIEWPSTSSEDPEVSQKIQIFRQFEIATNKNGEQILRMVSMESKWLANVKP